MVIDWLVGSAYCMNTGGAVPGGVGVCWVGELVGSGWGGGMG